MKMIKVDNKYAGYKMEYEDGIGYTFGQMFYAETEPDPMLIQCMDIPEEDIDKMIELLNRIKEMEPISYEEEYGEGDQ